ncbi:MAG: GDSL-type esterase/lipase family protein [Deltaproteobacteria bacterium]|jgi:phospholipase/lecithinase/hemolysin|nr:GDSL-type esterase/lipase family protein [Deltaproteobacteria bacterium]
MSARSLKIIPVFCLAVLAALGLVATSPARAAAPQFTSVIAFGDSYSDNGFADGWGFQHYTESVSWVEMLAQKLGVPVEVRAWGGAMSNQRNYSHPEGTDWSGLAWQVDGYLKDLAPGTDVSDVLFTVLVGSNDAWGGIRDGKITAANIAAEIDKLAAAGARHILYVETSAVILGPGYLAGEWAGYAEPWANLVNQANAETRVLFADGLKDHPDVKLYYLQTDPIMTKIKNKEEGYVFENITDTWKDTYNYPEPGKYLWFDEWHPMSHFHQMVSDEALAVLSAE